MLCWLLVFAAPITGAASESRGSVRFNAETHVAVGSAGCGKASPYKVGKTSVATGRYAGVTWTYRIYVPNGYDSSKPMPLIIQHPGWGLNAKSEEKGCGITDYADKLGFISVTAQGMDDNKNRGGPWYSWNAAGTTQSPGPGGPTCTNAASAPSYCYSSCSCTDKPQCDWTTCDETGPTPTGTGRKNIGGFIPGLYDTLEGQLCIDTTREYAAGESNGGMMTYQLGVDLSHRLAAIAPQFGSFHRGFNLNPVNGVPVIDIHGAKDTTIPANVSLAGNGYYYTTTAEIFGGNKYSPGWKSSNGCSGPTSHYPTSFDGVSELYCVSEGACTGGDVVRCAWNGGHNWFGNNAKDNGGLVTEFLTKWAKPSHIGRGYVLGEELGPGQPLEDVAIALDTQEEPSPAVVGFEDLAQTLTQSTQGHYGNPERGCQDDEDVIFAGTGRVCTPKIPVAAELAGPPTPKCRIGGFRPVANGCPIDAAVTGPSKAWPICLAKGNSTAPYDQGDFHCLLVCPCAAVDDNDCGAEAHLHCPIGGRCERGELQNMAHGICTFHSSSRVVEPESVTIYL